MLLRSKRGQAFSEYAIFIGIILAAFMAMQHYLRNSVSGKLKAGADYMLNGEDGLGGTLYDPMGSKDMASGGGTTGGSFTLNEDGSVSDSRDTEVSTQYGNQTWQAF